MKNWNIKDILVTAFMLLFAIALWFFTCVMAGKMVCLLFKYGWSWRYFLAAWISITFVIVWFSVDEESSDHIKNWIKTLRNKKK